MNKHVSVQKPPPELINLLPEKERERFICDLKEIRKRVQNILCGKRHQITISMKSIVIDLIALINKNDEYDMIRSLICGFAFYANSHLYMNECQLAVALSARNLRSFITCIHNFGYEKYTRISFEKDQSLCISLFPTELPFDKMSDKGKNWSLYHFVDNTNGRFYNEFCNMLQINPIKFIDLDFPFDLDSREKSKKLFELLNFINFRSIQSQEFSSFIEKASKFYMKKNYINKFLNVLSVTFPNEIIEYLSSINDNIKFCDERINLIKAVYFKYHGHPYFPPVSLSPSIINSPPVPPQQKLYPIPIIKEATKNTEKDYQGIDPTSSPFKDVGTFEYPNYPECNDLSAEFNIPTQVADRNPNIVPDNFIYYTDYADIIDDPNPEDIFNNNPFINQP